MLDHSLIKTDIESFNIKISQAYTLYLENPFCYGENSIWQNYHYNPSNEPIPFYHDDFCQFYLNTPNIISSLPYAKLLQFIPYFINQFLKHDEDVFFVIEHLIKLCHQDNGLSFETLENILDSITSVDVKGNLYWSNILYNLIPNEMLSFYIKTPISFLDKYESLSSLSIHRCQFIMFLIQYHQLTPLLLNLFKHNLNTFLQILPEICSESFYSNKPKFMEDTFITIYKNQPVKQREIIKNILIEEQSKNIQSHQDYFQRTLPLLDNIDFYYSLQQQLFPISLHNKDTKPKI